MPYELTGFDGKVAVVTGAGRMRSIGRSIAVELARAGCDIVLTGSGRPADRYPPDEQIAGWRDIESVADEIRAIGRRALPVVSDVADVGAVQALGDVVEREFGHADIVVNNAGAKRGNDRNPVIEIAPEDWRSVVDVNLHGSFYMCQVFGRQLVCAGTGGSIVNISSIAGKMFEPNSAAYAASKSGIHALSACMAREVAQYNVRVNSVCPGIVDTSRMDDLGRESDWEEFVKGFIPLGRPGTGMDIAHIVLYLCSDQGAWVTGQAWNVDGGMLVQH